LPKDRFVLCDAVWYTTDSSTVRQMRNSLIFVSPPPVNAVCGGGGYGATEQPSLTELHKTPALQDWRPTTSSYRPSKQEGTKCPDSYS
jgi:hypothetical protein